MTKPKLVRTTVFLTQEQSDGLAALAKADLGGLKASHILRRFVSEGLQRQAKQAKQPRQSV